MEPRKCPQIANLREITPEQATEYVKYVSDLRKMQRMWFEKRLPYALNESKRMEAELDKLNERLLDDSPTLF